MLRVEGEGFRFKDSGFRVKGCSVGGVLGGQL